MMTKTAKSLLARFLLPALLGAGAGIAQAADDLLKPFTLAFNVPGQLQEKIDTVKGALEAKGFQVVGEYVPYENAHIVVVTSDELKKEAAKSKWGGFGAGIRVAVNKVGDNVQVSYNNPTYMSNAYRMDSDLASVAGKLEAALGRVEDFGAKGLTPRKLRKYHYTFGMEYFDNPYKLASYGSYKEAVAAVEKNLAANEVGVRQVYRIDIPGKEETVIGVSMKGPTPDDKYIDDTFQMSVVDFEGLKQNAYLPYEVMVSGNEVIAMHMRFRMAVHFPDLKMMGGNSFMTLMPSPAAIEKALTKAVGG